MIALRVYKTVRRVIKKFQFNSKPSNETFKMKFAIVILLACIIAAAFADPIQVTDNNVGNIITVNANAVASNQVESNIMNILLGLLNQQVVAIAANDSP